MRILLIFLMLLCGCGTMIDAEIGLIDQSRKGVEMIGTSIESRREMILKLLDKDRAALNLAFDEDVIAQTSLESSWVIEARRAYAQALDALVRRDESVVRSIDADLENLRAIDEALIEIERLNRQQRGWFELTRQISK